MSSLVYVAYFKRPTAPPATDKISDPNIVFDNSSKRFFASLMHQSNESIRVAVSAPNDPKSAWKVVNFKVGNCPDQPFIGVSSDKVAISTIVSLKIVLLVRHFLGHRLF